MAGLGPGGRVKKAKGKGRRRRPPAGFIFIDPARPARGVTPIPGGPADRPRVSVKQAAATARKRALARGIRTQVRKQAGAALPAAEIAILRAKEVRRQAQRRAGRVAGRLKGPRFE
jgi:hypothetical protein